ncbi:MAG TPA: ABC transporter ATP-binding protein [Ktedonobacteraceae bacterium]
MVLMTYNNPLATGDHAQSPSPVFRKRRLQAEKEQPPIEAEKKTSAIDANGEKPPIEEIDTHVIPAVSEFIVATGFDAPPQLDEPSTYAAHTDADIVNYDIAQQQTQRQAALTIPHEHRPNKGVPVISVRHLTKTYQLGKETVVQALRGVSLDVYPGEFVVVLGPSGSGKSTFMNLIGCLDRPSAGEYWLAGKLVSKLSNDDLADARNRLIGFVFQGFNLLSRATAVKNVALPMVYAGLSKQEREKRARKVLKLVGLGARINHKPSELSGGQQQRVAVARALVNGPSLLLADEPTGNLDSRTSVEIMAVLQALNNQGLTIVLVTHDLKVADYARRQISFLDGAIVKDEMVKDRRFAQDEWLALNKKATDQAQPASAQTAVKEKPV